MVSQPLFRIKSARLCNEAIDGYMDDTEQQAMMAAAARKVEELFDVLQIDHRNDHNTRDTPKRVAKMFVQEMLRGRYNAPPDITDSDNADGYSGLIVTGPIEVRSTCAHHLMPIYGEAYIGILPSPDGRIIGLSKYDRIVD
jgi:GTP cyclohydrolase I